MEDDESSGRRTRFWFVVTGCALATAAFSMPAIGDSGPDSSLEASLPTVVNAPGTWSKEEGVRGPVAAMGLASRTQPRGVFGEIESLDLFAVSALDGSATWLDLADYSLGETLSDGVALSPNGRWIGWVRNDARYDPGRGRIAGYAVLDTTTGEVREFADPSAASLRPVLTELTFSGDSRHLLTNFAVPAKGSRGSGSDQFVAWDVESGVATVLEEPGEYWLPNLGSASSGVVWSRGRDVFRTDPASGAPRSTRLPQDVITASWGPDDTSFAYIGRSGRNDTRWRLYVGTNVEEAVDREVEMPHDAPLAQLLGWQDPTHVVVGHYRTWVHIVDVETGEAHKVDMAGYGRLLNAPVLANGLWQRPLRTPAEPTGTSDPRRHWLWSGLMLLIAGAGVLVARRRKAPSSSLA